ncbi:hypothetical protein ALQ26_200058 [Pseudomonas amygdali pv. lachrymans]|nr:hypothetical protein ALQ26_200058 [Pseudomonas amygdali pv. lachrymans]
MAGFCEALRGLGPEIAGLSDAVVDNDVLITGALKSTCSEQVMYRVDGPMILVI